MRRTLIIFALLIGLCTACYVGWVCGRDYGLFVGALGEFERRYEAERELVAPVLAADPAFQRLMTVNFPVNGICLGGPVETPADYDRLRAEMVRLLGEPRIGHVLADVWVERAAEPGPVPHPGGR